MKLHCIKSINFGDIVFTEGKQYEYEPEYKYIYGGHKNPTIWWKFHNSDDIKKHFCNVRELRKLKLEKLK